MASAKRYAMFGLGVLAAVAVGFFLVRSFAPEGVKGFFRV